MKRIARGQRLPGQGVRSRHHLKVWLAKSRKIAQRATKWRRVRKSPDHRPAKVRIR